MAARLVFLTHRARVHQEEARSALPPDLDLDLVILDGRTPESDVLRALETAEFLISERDVPVTRRMIEAAPRLRLAVRLGSLLYDVDLEAAARAGVRVVLQPVLTSIFAAEHALMLALALLRRLGRARRSMRASPARSRPTRPTDEDTFAFDWNQVRGVEPLYGRRVAILGMGEIGVELARRLLPFRPGAIDYVKRRRYPQSVEADLGVRFQPSADAAIAEADLLVSLLPFSAATNRFLSRERLARMKPRAVLVHVGSGGVIDEDALAALLRERRIAGAALDTFAVEPLPIDSALHDLAGDPDANLILTPHIASLPLPESRAEDFRAVAAALRGAS